VRCETARSTEEAECRDLTQDVVGCDRREFLISSARTTVALAGQFANLLFGSRDDVDSLFGQSCNLQFEMQRRDRLGTKVCCNCLSCKTARIDPNVIQGSGETLNSRAVGATHADLS
jgi:hypothetical protein